MSMRIEIQLRIVAGDNIVAQAAFVNSLFDIAA
jgi:hypothetical protein